MFTGAKEVIKLNEYSRKTGVPNFNMAVDFGWFWFMTKPFFYILHFFDTHIGNMGIAIILLTIVIRSAVFPLTSYRSFAKMKKSFAAGSGATQIIRRGQEKTSGRTGEII